MEAGIDKRFNSFCCWAAQEEYERTHYLNGYKQTLETSDWDKEAVRLFKKHIFEVICDRDERKQKHFTDWLTHIIQFPSIKTGKCMVVFGVHGGGKSVIFEFLVAHVFGKTHGEFFTKDGDGESRFTQDQAKISLTVFEDMRQVAGKKTGTLKNLCTAAETDEKKRKGTGAR